jgi:20S proteasome alpha/beta subunit
VCSLCFFACLSLPVRYEAYEQKAPELEDAIHIALLTLKEGFDGQIDETNIEVGVVTTDDRKFRILSGQEVKDYLKEVE